MKKPLISISLFLIIVLGFFFRFIGLTQIPAGFNWDEASVGYNAYSLLETGRDEFGRSWPIFIESFGDYKTGLYSIALVPIIKHFGLSIFSVRILNVFVGTSAILASYFLGLTYFKKQSSALILALLMATSPLTIHFSRFTLEWYAALPLFLVGMSLIISDKKRQLKLPLGAFFLGFSLYWYHSLRLFLPLLLICYVITYKTKILKNPKTLIISLFVGALTITPLFLSLKQSNILARPQAVAIFSNEDHQRTQIEGLYRFTVSSFPLKRVFTNKAVYYGQEIAYRYLSHFSLDFLFFGKDATPRISVYPIGKMQLVLLPFLLIGFIQIFKKYKHHRLLLGWILLSPLPASLTNDAPHGLRSLFLLPALLIVVVIGLNKSYQHLNKIKKSWQKSFILSIGGILFFSNFLLQMSQYFLFYPELTSSYWQADQQDMIKKLQQYENEFPNIVVTKFDGQPHIFYAFFTQLDPKIYQKEVQNQEESFNTRISKLGKIKFGIQKTDYCQLNTLIITKDYLDILNLEPIDITYLPNRFHNPKEAFYFYDTNDPIIQEKVCVNETTKK